MKAKNYHCQKISDFPSQWGQAILRPTGEATFHSEIFSFWDAIASFPFRGEAGIGWFELTRRPFTGNEVERHCLTPEALLCIQGSAVCFVGEPADPEHIDVQKFGAFCIEQEQGFIFSPGTWHAIPFPMTEKTVFLVIFRKGTPQEDLQILNLEQAKGIRFRISLEDKNRNGKGK